MIAVDTNLLVYAHREDSQWHHEAYDLIAGLAKGPAAWSIPWPCVHEFIAIVTHPRIFLPPTPLPKALDQVSAWVEVPSLMLLAESDGYWTQLAQMLRDGRVTGPQVHDARIAALCAHHGISELWTADRDFSRFPEIKTRNPLVK